MDGLMCDVYGVLRTKRAESWKMCTVYRAVRILGREGEEEMERVIQ